MTLTVLKYTTEFALSALAGTTTAKTRPFVCRLIRYARHGTTTTAIVSPAIRGTTLMETGAVRPKASKLLIVSQWDKMGSAHSA